MIKAAIYARVSPFPLTAAPPRRTIAAAVCCSSALADYMLLRFGVGRRVRLSF